MISNVTLKNSKILVLGGTGHLGSNLIHYLIKELQCKVENIRVFYLAGTPTYALKDIEGLNWLPGNILDKEAVISACSDREFVFHMVGNTSFDPRQKNIQWNINVEGTRNVLEACLLSKTFKRLCYTSTINVLGLPNPLGSVGKYSQCSPYNKANKLHTFSSAEACLRFIENVKLGVIKDPANSIDIAYLDSKLAAQELVNVYHEKYGLDVVSVLPGTMLGAYDYLISAGMYVIALHNGKVPGLLKGGMSFLHVKDAVRGHLLALTKAVSGKHYVITGNDEDHLYLKDFVKLIAEVLQEENPNKKIKVPQLVFNKQLAWVGAILSEFYAKLTNTPLALSRTAVKAGSVASFYGHQEASQDLAYKPEFTLKQAIEDSYNYYLENNLLTSTTRFIDKR